MPVLPSAVQHDATEPRAPKTLEGSGAVALSLEAPADGHVRVSPRESPSLVWDRNWHLVCCCCCFKLARLFQPGLKIAK